MKRLSLAVMAIPWMIFFSASPLKAAAPVSLPDTQVPAINHGPNNYDELVANITKVAGLKVIIDPALEAYVKEKSGQFWSKWSIPQGTTDTTTLKHFLDQETSNTDLHWELDQSSHTITFSLAWRRNDERSSEDLLKALRQAHEAFEKMPPKKITDYSPEWKAARKPQGLLLNALLSKKENYDKAWKTKTTSLHRPDALGAWIADCPDIILADDFADASGKRGVLVVVRHALTILPGEGGFSYYYFTPEGSLVNAGLFSSGGDCGVISASVNNGKKSAPSKLSVKVYSVGYSENVVQKFVMEPNELRHTELIRANGEVLTGDGMKNFPTVVSLVENAAQAK